MKTKIISLLILLFSDVRAETCPLAKRQKMLTSDASLFSMAQYEDGYQLTVKSPWVGEKKDYRYLLYRTKPLEHCPGLLQIKIPIQKLVAFSTSYLPSLKELGVEKTLVGMVDARYISDEKLIERVKQGKISSLGFPPSAEKVMMLNPDVVMAFVSESPELEGLKKLEQLKLPIVYNADFRETTPLGRAEWIRFIGAFYDRESEANSFYQRVRMNYYQQLSDLKKKTQSTQHKPPKVLLGEKRDDQWVAPGAGSYLHYFVTQAGGEYLFADFTSEQPLNFSFEKILPKARSAERWISFPHWQTSEQAIKHDSRNRLLFESIPKIYVGNKLAMTNGGNDYFETGALRPDLVLQDFIAMIHAKDPQNLKWFQPLSINKGKNK